MITNFNWNATAFFQELTEQNKLAKEKGFRFCRVTGLQGFEEDGSLEDVLITDMTAEVTDSDEEHRRLKFTYT
ncbi:MAG: hypothetical protein J6W75_09990 [Bacteroidaceae bacterium]|nr:hypothetical protein [Bacteroidaceae bacterium]